MSKTWRKRRKDDGRGAGGRGKERIRIAGISL